MYALQSTVDGGNNLGELILTLYYDGQNLAENSSCVAAQDILVNLFAQGWAASTVVNHMQSLMFVIDNLFADILRYLACYGSTLHFGLTEHREMLYQLKYSLHFYEKVFDNNQKEFLKEALSNFAFPNFDDICDLCMDTTFFSPNVTLFMYLYSLAPARATDLKHVVLRELNDLTPIITNFYDMNKKPVLYLPDGFEGDGHFLMEHSKQKTLVWQKLNCNDVQWVKSLLGIDGTVNSSKWPKYAITDGYKCMQDVYYTLGLDKWHDVYLDVTNQQAQHHSMEAFFRKVAETTFYHAKSPVDRMCMGHTLATGEQQYVGGHVWQFDWSDVNMVPNFDCEGRIQSTTDPLENHCVLPNRRNSSYTEKLDVYLNLMLEMDWYSSYSRDDIKKKYKNSYFLPTAKKRKLNEFDGYTTPDDDEHTIKTPCTPPPQTPKWRKGKEQGRYQPSTTENDV